MSDIKISAIAAMAKNHVIGKGNQIPWHIPEDFKYFKRTTLGKPIIMGRKTWDSLGGKALPKRANIVISRNPQTPADGLIAATSIDEAIKTAKDIAQKDGIDEIFIIGGSEIYRQTLPQTNRLYLTVIDKDYDGDAKFPDFAEDEWSIISQENHAGDPSYTYFVYARR